MKKTVAFILLLVPLLAAWRAPTLGDAPFFCNDAQAACESPFAESNNFLQETEDQEHWNELLGPSQIWIFLTARRNRWLTIQNDHNTDGSPSTLAIRAPPLH